MFEHAIVTYLVERLELLDIRCKMMQDSQG